MAKRDKKTSETSGDKERFVQKAKLFFKDERTCFALGILLLISSFYLFLALFSFLFTAGSDQSLMSASWPDKVQVENWTGFHGAKIAYALINKGFGVSVFAALVFPVVLGFRLMNMRVMHLWKAFLFSGLFLVWGSVFFSFFFFELYKEWPISLGGAHGDTVSAVLYSNIGWGVVLLLFVTLLVFLIFASKHTVPWLKKIFGKKPKLEPAAAETEQQEPTVAVGTEIVPDEWVEIPEEEGAAPTEIKVVSAPMAEDLPMAAPDSADGIEIDTEVPADGDVVENVGADLEPYDPTADLSRYKFPTLDLLKEYPMPENVLSQEEKDANQKRIISTLQHYGIGIKKIYETVGPTITLYEIVPEDGVRISKIRNLEADIMLSLAATGIRIIAPIPGKGTIGIEVPNSNPRIVSMYATIGSKKFQESTYDLPVALGRTITNEVFMFDLCKMPHLLVAGATGQGKSVGLNAIITSLLYKKHPSQLKFVLVDPKKVEFNIYSDIENHFLAKLPDADEPVITDVDKVKQTLNSICKEMDSRYDLLKMAHVRNIKEYNEKFVNRRLNPEKGHRYLPYIVVIVDEFGDLIMTAGKEVEMPIARIAQLARAVGIHMVIATQRPSVNIITGIIKANFPARVAFKVSAMVDSKTILDTSGAQQLIGRGDLLFSQGNDPVRVQCAFVDTPEVEKIVHYISEQQAYPSAFLLPECEMPDSELNELSGVDMTRRDPLFDEAARMIVASQQGSTSNIQRKFSIGYNRAGRIMDQLEAVGIIGPQEGSKPRQVFVQTEYALEQMLGDLK